VTGLIHRAGDVDELADNIKLVMNEPEMLEQMRNAIPRGRDRLTWDATAERLEGCYELDREACPRFKAWR
jgi:glycosyltransferase involved in cell wall biosynthesis